MLGAKYPKLINGRYICLDSNVKVSNELTINPQNVSITQFQELTYNFNIMEIEKNENELNGNWIYTSEGVIEDEVAKRIKSLTESYLIKIDVSISGWEMLYQDPNDGRFWELIYKQSDLHGGGPPSLIEISIDEAKSKYSIAT